MSAPAKKTIELFYDVISPFSFIGFEVLSRYESKWNLDIQYKPVLAGGVIIGSKNSPPPLVAAKFAHAEIDVVRQGKHTNIPLKYPKTFLQEISKGHSLSAMRLLTAIGQSRPQYTEPLTRELFTQYWIKNEGIADLEALMKAGKRIGMSDEEVADFGKQLADGDVKTRLKEVTKECVDHGAFGVPWMVAHAGGEKHMVFGSDRFHTLADILGEEYAGPLNEQSKLVL